jgi:hypothetical protein
MADRQLYTNEAALAEATEVSEFLADAGASPVVVSKLRLFDDSLVPTVLTTKTDLEAAETTLTGYPVGGYTVTSMGDPLFAPGGGAIIMSNKIDVAYASGAAVAIGGYWLEDPAGDVRTVYVYDPPRNLAEVGNGWPIIVALGYGRNSG